MIFHRRGTESAEHSPVVRLCGLRASVVKRYSG
jgi:hypothetical protein